MSNGMPRRSLQQKVSLTLLVVMAIFVFLTYVILHSIVGPAFDRLELVDAERNLKRAERAIQSELTSLDSTVSDWSSWDDAYAYARGENSGFRESNLEGPTLTRLNLNLLLIRDDHGRELWGKVMHGGIAKSTAVLGVFNDGAPWVMQLLQRPGSDGAIHGLLRTELGPMLLSARPILTSFDQGPIAGSMIMAQLLDDERMASLRDRTEVDLRWHMLPPGQPAGQQYPQALNGALPGSVLHESTAGSITSSGVLNNLFGEPLLMLEVSTPRNVSALGIQTVNGALLFLSLAGIVVAVVTWLLLRSIIVLPLEGLAKHITRIRKSGDLEQKLNAIRSDEIGSLAGEFDKMTTELHDARRLLLEQSFKAGKADTAAEVLHNIRNAMTPLINGIERLAKYLKVADNLRVSEVTGELRSSEAPENRKEKLIQYVESAFDHIKVTCNEANDELNVVSKQARQVEAILSDQERYANVAPVMEDLGIAELLDEAILVIPQADHPEIEISLPKSVPDCRVKAHRVGLLQVLGNVVLNAYESIKRCPPGSGRIQLTTRVETVEDREMVRVTIRDSGCGFDSTAGTKIFQRGYSSKIGHMSGLGLHWCANALAGMGGRILAESDGPGTGAEFHVLLPAAKGGLQ